MGKSRGRIAPSRPWPESCKAGDFDFPQGRIDQHCPGGPGVLDRGEIHMSRAA